MELTLDALPPTAEFMDVDGIPVTLDMASGDDPITCLAWDTDPPRKFNFASALHNGSKVSRSEFEKLMANHY